jgi:hypothetical protein
VAEVVQVGAAEACCLDGHLDVLAIWSWKSPSFLTKVCEFTRYYTHEV